MPRVSVVIPAFNAERFLAAAIDSVLAQSVDDLEVLVVDDGSTDATPVLAREYGPPVKHLRQDNAGVSVARNRGIAESRAPYVAFLDADDTWLPGKLETQLTALERQPTRKLCHSAFFVVDAELRPLGVTRHPPRRSALEDLLLDGTVVGCPTVLCERELIDRTGGFDATLSQCADWDMWIRLAQHTEFVYVDEPLARYRQHSSNMSADIARYERDAVRVLEKAFRSGGLGAAATTSHRRKAFGRAYMVLAGSYYRASRPRDFLRCALRALVLDPRQLGRLLDFPRRMLQRRSAG